MSTALNQPIACYEYLKKNIVLHCSAFEYKGKANILLGLPKSGKSTLLGTGLDQVKFITEDIGIISKKGEITPSTPLIKLQKEDINKKYFEILKSIPGDERKRIVCRLKKSIFADGPKLINRIFFINRCEKSNFESISPRLKIAKLLSSSFRPFEFHDNDSEKDFFLNITKILELDAKQFNISHNEKPSDSFNRLLNFIESSG